MPARLFKKTTVINNLKIIKFLIEIFHLGFYFVYDGNITFARCL